MSLKLEASEFKDLKGIEYFQFEEDFVEENMRCIPMIVRFKMDAVGIKLKLAEWSKFNRQERIDLAIMSIDSISCIKKYHNFLTKIIEQYTGNKATELIVEKNPDWANIHTIPLEMEQKVNALNLNLSVANWGKISPLKRFALIKLCRSNHENKNFKKAFIEFGL
jgi:hypothetical protein